MFSVMESLRAARESLQAHALRSFLSTLGIAIGITAVIIVVALMQGVQKKLRAEFEGLGGNGLTITSFASYDQVLKSNVSRLTHEDFNLISNQVEGVASITPVLTAPGRFTEVRNGPQVAYLELLGTTHTYQEVHNAYIDDGRFISVADNQRRRRVAVLGHRTAKLLSLPDDPIGHYINIAGEWLLVIGVLEASGAFDLGKDNRVLLPYAAMQAMNGAQTELDIDIRLTVAEGVDADVVGERIRRLLRQAHGLKPSDDDDFTIQSSEELGKAFENLGGAVTAGLAGVVGISLLVGGIGIMNIMLVSVTERTREIGILKALGATRRQILLQFLTEAIALSLLGGLAGLALSFGLSVAIDTLVDSISVAVPLWAVALAVGFTTATGVAFGILPASKAADLHPIEALRYE